MHNARSFGILRETSHKVWVGILAAVLFCPGGLVLATVFENIHSPVSEWFADPDEAEMIHGHISTWDVSRVSTMAALFGSHVGSESFNEDLSLWDTSRVTNANGMFLSVTAFNSDLSGWDVSRIRDLSSMFDGAAKFNSDVSSWDCARATTMHSMFREAVTFDADVSNWDTSRVTSTRLTFDGTSAFEGNLNWDVSRVTDMEQMFRSSNFNGEISGWDTSRTINMRLMFSHASVYNGDISRWDVSKVDDMSNYFNSAVSFNSDISRWDVTKVEIMDNMFNDAGAFDQDLNDWDITRVMDFNNIFGGNLHPPPVRFTSFCGDAWRSNTFAINEASVQVSSVGCTGSPTSVPTSLPTHPRSQDGEIPSVSPSASPTLYPRCRVGTQDLAIPSVLEDDECCTAIKAYDRGCQIVCDPAEGCQIDSPLTSECPSNFDPVEFEAGLLQLCGEPACMQAFSDVTHLSPFLLRHCDSNSCMVTKADFLSIEEQCHSITSTLSRAECQSQDPFITTEECCSIVKMREDAMMNGDANLVVSLTNLLCGDPTCLVDYPAVSDAEIFCRETNQFYSSRCIIGSVGYEIGKVSQACCDGYDAFREATCDPFSGLDPAVESVVCGDPTCFEAYSAALGREVMETACQNNNMLATPSPTTRSISVDSCLFAPRPPRVRGDQRPDGTPCGEGGRCHAGVCAYPPSCIEYDRDVAPKRSPCESFGLGGEDWKYVYARPLPLSFFEVASSEVIQANTFETLGAIIDVHLAISMSGTAECYLPHLRYACSVTYPKCKVVDNLELKVENFDPQNADHTRLLNVELASSGTDGSSRFVAIPQQTCDATCVDRNLKCKQSDDLLSRVIYNPPRSPNCNGRFGDEQHPPSSFEYFSRFAGQHVYPHSQSYTSTSDENKKILQLLLPLPGYLSTLNSLNCPSRNDARPPVVEVQCQEDVGSAEFDSSLFDGADCEEPYLRHPDPNLATDSLCVLPCLLPIYADAEVDRLFWTFVIPSLIGSSLCALGLITYFRHDIWNKRKSRFPPMICALGAVYGLVNILPVLISYLAHDPLPCSGATILDKSDSSLCGLNRVSQALLISMYYTMALFVTDARLRQGGGDLQAGQRYIQLTREKKTKVFAFLIAFGIPTAAGVAIVALDTRSVYDDGDSLYWAYVARDMFSCSARLPSLWLEIFVVHVHFVICSAIVVWQLFHSLKTYLQLPSLNTQSSQFSSTEIESRLKLIKLISNAKQTHPTIVLAVVMFFFLVLELCLAILLHFEWTEIGVQTEEFLECKNLESACSLVESETGQMYTLCDGNRDCGDFESYPSTPTVALLGAFYFSRAGLLLAVGMYFNRKTWQNCASLGGCTHLALLKERMHISAYSYMWDRRPSSECISHPWDQRNSSASSDADFTPDVSNSPTSAYLRRCSNEFVEHRLSHDFMKNHHPDTSATTEQASTFQRVLTAERGTFGDVEMPSVAPPCSED